MIKKIAATCVAVAIASVATAGDGRQAYDKNEALSPETFAMIKASYDPAIVLAAK